MMNAFDVVLYLIHFIYDAFFNLDLLIQLSSMHPCLIFSHLEDSKLE